MRRLAALVIGLASLVVVATNGLLGHRTPSSISISARALALLVFLLCFQYYVQKWATDYRDAFPKPSNAMATALGIALDADEIWPLLEAHALSTTLSPVELFTLSRQVARPASYRERTVETIALGRRTQRHTVGISFKGLNASPRSLVCFARPAKTKVLEDCTFSSSSNTTAAVVPFLDSAAIMYQVCLAWIHQYSGASVDDAHRKAVGRLVATSDTNASDVESIFRVAMGHDFDRNVAPSQDRRLHDLLETVLLRRPMFMYVDTTGGTADIEYSYTERTATNTRSIAGENKWNRLKSWGRDKIGLSPTQVGFSIARATMSTRYVLNLEVPDGMYIAETGVVDKSLGMLPKLEHGEMYKSYFNWRRPAAQSKTSFAARQLRLPGLNDPHLLIRLEERPPGTLATATITSFATAFSLWICAVLVSAGLGTNGTDIVAFLLAAPGVAAIALGLNLTEGSNRLRSLTGVLSLVTSLTLSITGIATYLARTGKLIAAHPFNIDNAVFFVYDKAWVVIVCVAIANAAWASATLGTRLVRYMHALRST